MTDPDVTAAPKNPRLMEMLPSSSRPTATSGLATCALTNHHQQQRPWKRNSCGILVHGQGKGKAGSSAILIIRLNRASMRFHNRANDGEAHSETFFFGGDKLVEELPANFRCDAAAPIANAQNDGVVAVSCGGNLHFALPQGCFVHGIQGIAHQVD